MMAFERLFQALRMRRGVRIDYNYAAAVQEWRPYFKGACVESWIGSKGYTIVGTNVGIAIVDDQAGDALVEDHDSLWPTSGARGVHHVGSVLTRGCQGDDARVL